MLKNIFFWISQGKVATLTGEVDKSFLYGVHVKFSQDLIYQKLLKSVNF